MPVCGVEDAGDDCAIGVEGGATAAIVHELDQAYVPICTGVRMLAKEKTLCAPVTSCNDVLLYSCEVSKVSPGPVPHQPRCVCELVNIKNILFTR